MNALVFMLLSFVYQPNVQPEAVPKPSVTIQDADRTALEKQLADLIANREKIDKQITDIRAKLKSKEAIAVPSNDIPDAAKNIARGLPLSRFNEPIVSEDLRITFKEIGFADRPFKIKKRFNIEGQQSIVSNIPCFGILVEIENTSAGKVIQPFPTQNMFGGKANLIATDNWGNKLKEEMLSSSEYEVSAAENAKFVTGSVRLKPGERKTWFLPLSTPEVSNFDWLVLYLVVERPDGLLGDGRQVCAFVPKDAIGRLADAIRDHEKH